MKTIKEGDRLNDVWMGTCYKCGAKVECTTDDLNYIFSPDHGEEISHRGEVGCPTCQYRDLPVTRQL
jgi:DNA-directed RNA polymerase subunit RPC12/RpoP